MRIILRETDKSLAVCHHGTQLGQAYFFVTTEDGTPIGCLTEVDTDEGYVIQHIPGKAPKRLEGKFTLVVSVEAVEPNS